MKKTSIAVLAAVLLVAAIGFAQNVRQLADIISGRPQVFTQPVHIGPAVGADKVFPSTSSRITQLIGGSVTENFAATAAGVCVDSASITVTGAAVGDMCIVSQPAAPLADAGLSAHFSCLVTAANTAKVRFCAGGAAQDPASATFNVLVVSNQ